MTKSAEEIADLIMNETRSEIVLILDEWRFEIDADAFHDGRAYEAYDRD